MFPRPLDAGFTCKALSLVIPAMLVTSFAVAQEDDVEEIVVTAAGYQQRIIDAPASISVVTRDELEKQQYTTIVDAMANIPGVYVTGGSNMQDISVRGMSDDYTLYLVDGRPISAGRSVNTNGNDGGKQIGLPPLAMIERVEVIRGPMSSLYGSEAMGGVVNVITRVTPETWGGSVAADYTLSQNDVSNDAYNTEFYLGGPVVSDVLGLEFNGALLHTDESDLNGGSDSAASDPESNTRRFGSELTWQVDAANRVTLAANTSNMEYTRTPGKSIEITDDPSSYEFDKHLFTLSHEGRYGDWSLNSFLQHDISDKVQTSTKKEEVTTFNTQSNYVADSYVLTLGGRYKLEDLVDETNGLLDANVQGATANVKRWIGALFAEAEWNFIENLGITTGLRYDDDELFGGHVSPRIYANWHSSDRLTFKGGISTGYSQPSLSAATAGFGRGTGGPGSPNLSPNGDSISRALIVGNPDLKPETSVNYEAGFIYNDKDLGFNTTVMAFHTTFKDKIAEDRYCISDGVDRNDYQNYTCDFGGNTYQFLSSRKNIDEAVMTGVEASVSYNLTDSLEVTANYTLTDSEQKTGDFEGEPLNKMPKNMANVGFDWQPGMSMDVWGRVNYRGETSDFLGRTSMSAGTPGYTLVDLGGVYHLSDQLKVMAGVYNVADKTITNDTYGVVLDGRRINMSLNYDF